jgi:hypothetical protein
MAEDTATLAGDVLKRVLLAGDLSKLTEQERLDYYVKVCESLKLNPLTRPFDYINLNGKLTLYSRRECKEQLRNIYSISLQILAREVVEGCYVVTAKATMPNGRADESLGAVPIDGLKGEARSNAMMKAETKAKSRVTLSICGLGMTDETELDSVEQTPAAPPPVEDFAVGHKPAATPSVASAPPPAKRETPPAPLPTQTVTMPSELETTTNKRMSDIRHIIREVGKFDAPTTEKVLSMFLRNFFGVTTLPKDPESYQAPLAVLEALTPAGVEELIKDPTAAGKKAREPLEKAFDTWKWTVESCAIAKDFIRAKAMTYADFITWINMTGADKLSSEDVSAFLLLATCTSKAYMLLQLPNIKAITEAVTCLIDQFGGFAGLKAAKPDDVAAAIQGLGPKQ